jgi:hypothetical protein
LPQQGFSMFGVPDENPLFSFDEVTAKAPYQEMRKGGRLRKKFATDGSVEGGEEDAEQTETAADEPVADEPVARTEEPAPKADVDGSVEYAPSDFVLPSSIQKKQPGFGNFEQEWRNDPLSQLLWNLGVQLVKNDRLPLDQAFMAAAPYAIKGLGDAIDYQRALEQKKAEAQHSAEFMRRLYPEGMASGGIVRKKYATNGAVMDEGGDFFGDLGSLFGGEEQQPAPRRTQQAAVQPQQGFDILGSLFGGEEEPQPRAGRTQPMAYAQQQDPIGGFFDSIFGPEEQPQPARKGAAQPQYQRDPSSNILDDILGGIFGGGEQPRLPTQPMAQPRTPEKATGAPATPEKPAVAEPKTAAPPTTTPATGDKATTPAAPAAPAEPAKPEASGSIENNPKIKQIDAEMRRVSSLYSQVQTEADAKAIRQRMADLNRQRESALRHLEHEQDRADRLAAAANKPKPLTPAEKQAEADRKITLTHEEKRKDASTKKAGDKIEQEGEDYEAAQELNRISKEYADAFTKVQSGGLKEAQLKALGLLTKDQARAISKDLYDQKVAYDIITKEGPEAVQNYTNRFKGAVRVAEIKMGEKGLPGLDKTPEANKNILANWMGAAQRKIDFHDSISSHLEKNDLPTQSDYRRWETEFENTKGHNRDDYKKHFYKRLGIAGSEPEVIDEETARELGIAAKPEKGKKVERSSGAPSGGIEVGHEEGGYRFKGGNPGDQSNWEKI